LGYVHVDYGCAHVHDRGGAHVSLAFNALIVLAVLTFGAAVFDTETIDTGKAGGTLVVDTPAYTTAAETSLLQGAEWSFVILPIAILV
jgi:hypothetical protein